MNEKKQIHLNPIGRRLLCNNDNEFEQKNNVQKKE